jgi:phage gpG-like protein
MIEIQVLGTEAVAAKLRRVTPSISNRLTQTMTGAMIRLQNYIKFAKLSGQVLKNQTGTLRRSINYTVSGGDGQEGAPVIGKVGTNVEYAKTHELGLTIPAHPIEAVRAQALAWTPSGIAMASFGGNMIFRRRVMIPAITMPKRSFLASGLTDKKPEIFKDLQAATAQGIDDATRGSR